MGPPRTWLVHGFQLAVFLLVAWGLYRVIGGELGRVDWQELRRVRPAAARLLLSTVLLVVVYAMHALLWRRILHDLTHIRASFPSTIRIIFLSSLGRYIPGKLWQVAGLALLARRNGLPALEATGAALLGQLAFLTTGALFLTIVLPAWSGWIPGAAAALVLLLAVAGLALAGSGAGGGRSRGRALLAPLTRILGARAASLQTVADRVRYGDVLFWLAGYALSWVVLGAAFVLFATSFAPAAIDQSRLLAGSVAAGYLGGYLALVPAGLGIREGVMALLLAGAMAEPVALLVAVLSRLWFTVGELVPLLIIPFLPQASGSAHPAEAEGGG